MFAALALTLAVAQPPGVPVLPPNVPLPVVNDTDMPSFAVFLSRDGKMYQRVVEWEYESFEGAETKLIEEEVDGKRVVREKKQMFSRPKQQTVLRPVAEDDTTFKTAGGELLTYKQAAARIRGGAACLLVWGDEPVNPLILAALKPDTLIVRWKAGNRGT